MKRVTLLRGDGIGPEIAEATIELIAATGAKIEWDEHLGGTEAIDKTGSPLPHETIESVRRNGVALKGPLMTPVGGGFRSVNVTLRQELELYANVRPVRSIQGVKTRFEDVDLVVVRENTEGAYSGLEHYLDHKKRIAQSIAVVSEPACDRIVRFAFELARRQKRKKVTLVHKANILKKTHGLFLEIGRAIAEEYTDIEFEDRIVDAMCMQLVLFPERFEVIVTGNLFGDILSDLTAGLVGGLGVTPSGNYGAEAAIFEAVHGTAPDIAGKGTANPTALLLSSALMLEHLGFPEEAARLENAVRRVLAEGKRTTGDLGGSASTKEYAAAIKALL